MRDRLTRPGSNKRPILGPAQTSGHRPCKEALDRATDSTRQPLSTAKDQGPSCRDGLSPIPETGTHETYHGFVPDAREIRMTYHQKSAQRPRSRLLCVSETGGDWRPARAGSNRSSRQVWSPIHAPVKQYDSKRLFRVRHARCLLACRVGAIRGRSASGLLKGNSPCVLGFPQFWQYLQA